MVGWFKSSKGQMWVTPLNQAPKLLPVRVPWLLNFSTQKPRSRSNCLHIAEKLIFQEISNRTHGSRTPKPGYLIALATYWTGSVGIRSHSIFDGNIQLISNWATFKTLGWHSNKNWLVVSWRNPVFFRLVKESRIYNWVVFHPLTLPNEWNLPIWGGCLTIQKTA